MRDFSSLLVCDRGAQIVSSIIHRCRTLTVRGTVTVHAFTSTSSAYAVENTETVKVQSDLCRQQTVKITKTSLYFSQRNTS